MKEHIKAWWSKPKAYPNGATFTRGEVIVIQSIPVLALVALVWGYAAFLAWDFGKLAQEWTWVSTHTLADVMDRNKEFLSGASGWVVIGVLGAIAAILGIAAAKNR